MLGQVDGAPPRLQPDFHQRASFELMPGSTTGLCNYSGVSFRWIGAPNYSLTAGGGALEIEPTIAVQSNGLTDDMQTFAGDLEEDSNECV